MLRTTILGMDLQNPVVIAPGPWSGSRKKLKKALNCGAGAVITESIVTESCKEKGPWYAYDNQTHGVENTKLYSSTELEEWIDILNEANHVKRYGSESKLIASVMGTTSSELRYIARKVERTGVDGIELGLACPMNEGPEIVAGDAQKVYEYAKTVVDAVDVPVSVKLTANTANLPEVVKAVQKAGVVGISAIDTIRGILNVDIDARKSELRTYGGFSGPPIKPIGLSTVAGIAQCTHLPIVGMGGISNYRDMLEYIMLGASACGLATAILLNGYDFVARITTDLDQWLMKNKLESIEEIRGAALDELRSFEEIKTEPKRARLTGSCTREDCRKCVITCMEEAIDFEREITINEEACHGCGFCRAICPDRKIMIDWR